MLIGKKVCLAPVLQADAPAFFSWFNSLDLAHSNGPYHPTAQNKFDQWFSGIGNDSSRVVFCIRQQVDLRLLGYVQITNIQQVSRTGELGILIGNQSDLGQGFGQESITMALAFCWRDLNLQRVSLFVIGQNPRAVHVYRKVGFEVEGTLRRASYVDGDFRDITVMGILRAEPMSQSAR
jgi:RimJ/RimL family protein N-acetyltransferase